MFIVSNMCVLLNSFYDYFCFLLESAPTPWSHISGFKSIIDHYPILSKAIVKIWYRIWYNKIRSVYILPRYYNTWTPLILAESYACYIIPPFSFIVYILQIWRKNSLPFNTTTSICKQPIWVALKLITSNREYKCTAVLFHVSSLITENAIHV
jgi:hypothetical protein